MRRTIYEAFLFPPTNHDRLGSISPTCLFLFCTTRTTPPHHHHPFESTLSNTMEGTGITLRVMSDVPCGDVIDVATGTLSGNVLATIDSNKSVGVWGCPQMGRVAEITTTAHPIAVAVASRIAVLYSDLTLRFFSYSGKQLCWTNLTTGNCHLTDTPPKKSDISSLNGVVQATANQNLVFVSCGNHSWFVDCSLGVSTPVGQVQNALCCAGAAYLESWRCVVGCEDGGVHLMGQSAVFSSHRVVLGGTVKGVVAAAVAKGRAFFACGVHVCVYGTEKDFLSVRQMVDIGQGCDIRSLSVSSDGALLAAVWGKRAVVHRVAHLTKGDTLHEAEVQGIQAPSAVTFLPLLTSVQHTLLKDADFRQGLILATSNRLYSVEVTDAQCVIVARSVLISVISILIGAALLTVLMP